MIGSGSITHNLAELSWQGDNSKVPEWASTFRNTVVSKLNHQDYDGVLEWQTLPFVKRNHPSLEHFAPLFSLWVRDIVLRLFIVASQWAH